MRFESGDISIVKADAIVNAANAVGYMGGWLGKHVRLRGVAESLHYATRGAIEQEARTVARKNKPSPGDVYITSAHALRATWVLHAVTMRKPGSRSSIEVIELCVDNIINECLRLGVHSLALPLLGTGTGRVNKQSVIDVYRTKLQKVEDVDVTVVVC